MLASNTPFQKEMRISASSAIIGMAGVSVTLGLLLATRPEPPSWLLALVVALLWATAMAWALERWIPPVGRYLLIATLAATIYVASYYLQAPALVALLALPASLAALLISWSAAVGVAACETLLLVVLPWLRMLPPLSIDRVDTVVALVITWTMTVLIGVVYRCAYGIARWSWGYYERAQAIEGEALTDRAELKQALDDLVHANHQLALANERVSALRFVAEKAEKTKAEFLSRVSHEFRTPLNVITGLAEVMIETPGYYGGEIPPRLSEHLAIMARNCQHLSRLVDDVLDLSQIDAGWMVLRRDWLNIGEIIDRALSLIRPLAEAKGVRLVTAIPNDLPAVYGDRVRLMQVIVNLLSNAVRFTDQGEIGASALCDGQTLTVTVWDTGPGIRQEDAESIFQAFQQARSQPGQHRGGSGLGLTISRKFIELHGGQMWLESELGSGSKFHFSLPVEPMLDASFRPERYIAADWEWLQRTPRVRINAARLDRRMIICTTDEDLSRSLARRAGEAECVHVASLAEAADEMQRSAAQAVLVNADSFTELDNLIQEARERLPDTPIIGSCVAPGSERVRAAGAAGYLVKPVSRHALQEAIAKLAAPVHRVLVVDDDADACELLGAYLRTDNDMRVFTASAGPQALDLLQAHPFDLVLLDVAMPGMDGWQVLAEMRKCTAIAGMPVIMVSAEDPEVQPLASPLMVATMGQGLSLNKLLRCSRLMAETLMQPD